MRAKASADGLQLAAIAGSYVTLLGMDMDERDCQNLLGFAVHRRDHTTGDAGYRRGQKAFRSAVANHPQQSYSTRQHPIQSFWWADYSAKPGHAYTYTVEALAGAASNPVVAAKVSVSVETERPHNGAHDIYFNRGVAASQLYARRFNNERPVLGGDPRPWEYLSRGLYEALHDYVRGSGPGTALRIAAYELNYAPFLDDVAAAVSQGADVHIIYDGRRPQVYLKTEAALRAAGLSGIATARRTTPAYISHNKFIVKMENGSPRSVWTGGTNFSTGGIFGHSNVAQVVEDAEIATKYLSYWQELEKDPTNAVFKPQVEALSDVARGIPASGTTVIFSPRASLEALDWYAARAQAARQALFMTFAFGMDKRFQDVYERSTAPVRLALMEKLVNGSATNPKNALKIARMNQLRRMPQNTFAVGSFVKDNALDGWIAEELSGLNTNVRYVHNKFMLIDPLSDDPLVVNGSANFSEASTRANDENMLVVRGDLRVADVFFTEFLRLHQHHTWRESLQWRKQVGRQVRRLTPGVGEQWLVEPGDRRWPWWSRFFDHYPDAARRLYYSNPYVP